MRLAVPPVATTRPGRAGTSPCSGSARLGCGVGHMMMHHQLDTPSQQSQAHAKHRGWCVDLGCPGDMSVLPGHTKLAHSH